MSSQSQKLDPDNPAKPKLCPKCQEKGLKSRLKMRRLFPNSEKVLLCKNDQCTWPYTLEEMTDLFQRSTQYLGTPEAQSTPIKTPTRRKRSAEAGRDEESGSPEVQKAKRERTEEKPPQPTPEVVLSPGVSASGEVGGGEVVRQEEEKEVRQEEEEEFKFEERNRSKMKSYEGRKTKRNPRKEEEESRQQEEIQKAREALEKRVETIDCDLSPSSEKILSVGETKNKYGGGSLPKKPVSLPAPPPRLRRDKQRRLDCSPTREEDVTIRPAMTDLGRKREIPGRKCKVAPEDRNRNQPQSYFTWKGEKIGFEEILELEEFYQNLASGNQHSVEKILKAEPKNSSISREKNFFFEVYLKYQLVIEMITNVSTSTLMSLLSFHHLDDENFKKLILKQKKEEEEADPPGSPTVTAGTPEPSPSAPAAVSLEVPGSGQEEPLDLSLPTRENARLGRGLEQAQGAQSGGLKKIQTDSTEEEGTKNHEEEAAGELKERKKNGVKGKGKQKKARVEVKQVKKEIKEKQKTTSKVQFVDKEGNSNTTSNGSRKDEDKSEGKKEEMKKSVFFSMEEEPQEIKDIIQPVPDLADLVASESATTITVQDKDLWKDLESVSDDQTAPGDLHIDLDLFNL